MQLRIERLAHRFDRLQTFLRENVRQLPVDHVHALGEGIEIGRGVRGRQRPLEVVQNGQQLFYQLLGGVLGHFFLFLAGAPPEVVVVRLQAEQALARLLGFPPVRLRLFQGSPDGIIRGGPDRLILRGFAFSGPFGFSGPFAPLRHRIRVRTGPSRACTGSRRFLRARVSAASLRPAGSVAFRAGEAGIPVFRIRGGRSVLVHCSSTSASCRHAADGRASVGASGSVSACVFCLHAVCIPLTVSRLHLYQLFRISVRSCEKCLSSPITLPYSIRVGPSTPMTPIGWPFSEYVAVTRLQSRIASSVFSVPMRTCTPSPTPDTICTSNSALSSRSRNGLAFSTSRNSGWISM